MTAPDYTDDYLRREHGRLVARLKRLVARAGVTGLPTARVRRLELTVRELIQVERLQRLDGLARGDGRAVRRALDVTTGDVQARLRLMAPGAGIEVPR